MEKSLKTSFWGVLVLHIVGLLLVSIAYLFMPQDQIADGAIIELLNVGISLSLFIAFLWQFLVVREFLARTQNHMPLHYLNMALILGTFLFFTILHISKLLDRDLDNCKLLFEPDANWTYVLFIIALIHSTLTYLLNLQLVASKIKTIRDLSSRKSFYKTYQNPLVNTVIGIGIFVGAVAIAGYLQTSISHLMASV